MDAKKGRTWRARVCGVASGDEEDRLIGNLAAKPPWLLISRPRVLNESSSLFLNVVPEIDPAIYGSSCR